MRALASLVFALDAAILGGLLVSAFADGTIYIEASARHPLSHAALIITLAIISANTAVAAAHAKGESA